MVDATLTLNPDAWYRLEQTSVFNGEEAEIKLTIHLASADTPGAIPAHELDRYLAVLAKHTGVPVLQQAR